MSALLSLTQPNQISWKGKTFNQLAASIKKNVNTTTELNASLRSQPLKHYRKELILIETPNMPNQRISISIDNINAPGTTIINSATTTSLEDDCNNSIVLNKNFNLSENKSNRPCYPNTGEKTDHINRDETGFSQASMARRRCRSSGIISKSNRLGTTNDSYKTSNSQYLESRGLTFKQNQYNYVKEGDKSVIPGDVMSMSNIYVGNNMSNYPKLLISSVKNNNYFQYSWINGIIYTLTIDDGYYCSEELTIFIQNKLKSKGHYYINYNDQSILYLFKMFYDSYNKRYNITCVATDLTIHSTYTAGDNSTIPGVTGTVVPNIIIPSTDFQKVVGISNGMYPPVLATTLVDFNVPYRTDQTFYGINAQIRPAYKPIYYKPNNINFAQQGAVNSSERILRKKINTITTAGSSFRSAFGSATANAVAYNVASTGPTYSLKEKTGYPNTRIPIINKYTGEVSCNSRQCMIKR